MTLDSYIFSIEVTFNFSFCQREGDEQRTYLALPSIIAPYKCSVLPLSKNEEFVPIVDKISKELTENDIAHKVTLIVKLITFHINRMSYKLK